MAKFVFSDMEWDDFRSPADVERDDRCERLFRDLALQLMTRCLQHGIMLKEASVLRQESFWNFGWRLRYGVSPEPPTLAAKQQIQAIMKRIIAERYDEVKEFVDLDQ